MAAIAEPEIERGTTTVTAPENCLDDFEQVFRQHRFAIYRFVLASVRDVDAAESLTQDCMLKAYRARAQFRGEASVKTWLMRIAVNLIRDHHSSMRLRFWRRQPSLDISLAAQMVADRAPSPELVTSVRQRAAAIWQAAEGLSDQQRTVLLLRFVEDMEILEIVEATGLREGTVKAHLFRAVQKIRARLEKLS